MTEKISVYHLRVGSFFSDEVESRGGQTVVAKDLEKSLEEVNFKGLNVLEFGVAECHEKDNYNRKLGRELAASRIKGHSMALIEFRQLPTKYIYTFGNAMCKITVSQRPGCRPHVDSVTVL